METKKELKLVGLHCSNCANKIQRELNKMPDIKEAFLNFNTATLTYEVEKEMEVEQTNKIKDLIKSIEPDVKVKDIDEDFDFRGDEHSHEHGHSHGHGEDEKFFSKNNIVKVIGAVLFVVSFFIKDENFVKMVILLAAYVLVGGEVLIRSFKNILKGEVFDENFLMSIATIGAIAVGQYPEAVAVMLFYEIGEFFQDKAVSKSRKSITELMDIRPDYANLKVGNKVEKVAPDKVNVGDVIMVKPGEKIPLDGKIIFGKSTVDNKALTGESLPQDVKMGDDVISGAINNTGVLTIKVEKSFKESTVSKILDLVQNSSQNKAKTEKFITKFARVYTPIVVISALVLAILPPLLIKDATFKDWIYRASTFLVVSCPCALVVSIPLSYFGGIGSASRHGVLVKSGNALEALTLAKIAIFDKTGTLTKGNFKVSKVYCNGDMEEEELLEAAAYIESMSNHPIASSIVKAYNKKINKSLIKNYEEISGNGVKGLIGDKEVLAGKYSFIKENCGDFKEGEEVGSVVYIAIEGEYVGYIVIEDEIKETSKSALKELKEVGVKTSVMLTGDRRAVAEKVSSELKIDKVYSELLPYEKVHKVEEILKSKGKDENLIFVGDGINDAPVLKRADIGIAMGGVGSDAAIEASDVVIMNDDIGKIATAIKIGKKTKKIVIENIYFSLFVKVLVLVLAALGLAPMWAAVFADVGVTLIAVLNSLRVLRFNP